MNQSIAILGTGALGTLMAWHWRHGNTFVCRRDNRPPMALRPDAAGSTLVTPLPLPQWSGEPLDWLVVCTKAADSVAALQEYSRWLPGVKRILLLQNGMGQQDEVAQWLHDNGLTPVLWAGTSTEGAYRDRDGSVVYAGRGQSFAGCWQATDDHTQLPPGVIADPQIRARLQAKLAVNAVINPLTARFLCRNGELLSNPGYHEQFLALAREVAALFDALGWHTGFDIVQQVQTVAAATAANQSSTLQDVLHKRQTELPYIMGYLLNAADNAGLSAPLTRDLYRDLNPQVNG